MITFDINPNNVIVRQNGLHTEVPRDYSVGTKNWMEFWEAVKEAMNDATICSECGSGLHCPNCDGY